MSTLIDENNSNDSIYLDQKKIKISPYMFMQQQLTVGIKIHTGVEQKIIQLNKKILITYNKFKIMKNLYTCNLITKIDFICNSIQLKCWLTKNQVPQKIASNLLINDLLKVINRRVISNNFSAKVCIADNGCLVLYLIKVISLDFKNIQKIMKDFINEFIIKANFQLPAFLDICGEMPNNLVRGIKSKSYQQKNINTDLKISFIHKYINNWFHEEHIQRKVFYLKNSNQSQNYQFQQQNYQSQDNNTLNKINSFYCYDFEKKQSEETFFISEQQLQVFKQYLRNPAPKVTSKVEQNKYIYNFIKITNQNQLKFKKIFQGSKFCLKATYIKYHYVETQPKLCFSRNISKNSLQKWVYSKIPINQNAKKLIKHQKSILSLFNSSSSAYVFKYYSNRSQNSMFENMILVDACQQQTLNQYLLRNKRNISIRTKLFFLCQIAQTLCFLQQKQVIHMKLNPSKIIIIKQLQSKIIDFTQAFSPLINNQKYKPPIILPYSAPQILNSSKPAYNSKQDIFSFGILAYRVFFGLEAFNFTNQIDQIYKNLSYMKKMFFVAQCSQWFSFRKAADIIISLIFKCLNHNPKKRPTASWITIILKGLMVYCINP